MAHRVDPNRGIFTTGCEVCQAEAVKCRLRMVGNRYLWACVVCREEKAGAGQ